MPSDQSILSKVQANQKTAQTNLIHATQEYVAALISSLNSKLRSVWKSKYDRWYEQNETSIKSLKAKSKKPVDTVAIKRSLDATYPKLYQIVPPGVSAQSKATLSGVQEKIYTPELFTFDGIQVMTGHIPPSFWNAPAVEFGPPDEKYSSVLKSDEIKPYTRAYRRTLADVKSQYDAARSDVQSYVKYTRSTVSKTPETSQTYEASVYIDQLQSLVKYSWSDPRLAANPDAYADYSDFIARNPYNPARAPSGSSGSGPGETWLGRLFGGSLQGMKQSFDLVLPTSHGQTVRYEVKAIEKDSRTIRAGAAHGLRAYHSVREKLSDIFNSMRAFCSIVEKNESAFKLLSTIRLHKLYNDIKIFCEDRYESMVMNGNITIDSIKQLRAVLNQILSVRSQMSGVDTTIDISYGGKTINVSPQKLRRILVLLADDDDDASFGYNPIQLAFAAIGTSEAFSNPDTFIKEMMDSVDISVVFPGIDGIIVSSPDGFTIARVEDFNTAFVLSGFREGRPAYNFVLLTSQKLPVRHRVNTWWRS